MEKRHRVETIHFIKSLGNLTVALDTLRPRPAAAPDHGECSDEFQLRTFAVVRPKFDDGLAFHRTKENFLSRILHACFFKRRTQWCLAPFARSGYAVFVVGFRGEFHGQKKRCERNHST